MVKPGKCPVECDKKFTLFLVIQALSGFTMFVALTPILIAVLRYTYKLRNIFKILKKSTEEKT